ncbi:hypothetical protein MW887_011072 [Aspergillus wentii]|nr:hypothetical protein MW887_011072 [Aspergillus wentii]
MLLNSKKDQSSSEPNQQTANSGRPSVSDSDKQPRQEGKAKTVAQADQELRERLEKMSGGGGASGIEYEDGQPNTMKRGVRNNMFRLI